ncbi:MAG: response regulator, partial [Dethiosulfovibrio sp.]|nr:response regulator [Dethiosulfovibrio sp.]
IQPVKILVFEDDPVCATVLREIVRPIGDCHVAYDPCDGVGLFKKALEDKEPYDCVFMDIMMPKMDGHQALEEIRKEESKKDIWGLDSVKVVMVTALGDFETIKKSFRGQCDGYLVKPIRKKQVFQILKDLEILEDKEL